MKIIVLTGAGMSAESGIPTFRGAGGLWEGYRIEDVASPEGWQKDQHLVLQFYNERRKRIKEAQPNTAHFLLAEMEKYHDVQIITQNIDDLHERAGSKNIIHLHGEIFKSRSTKNEQLIYDCYDDIQQGDTATDGCQLRPHIVWFGEMVPMMEVATQMMYDAEIVMVIGTSMVVYPAASLLYYAPSFATKYIINPEIPDMQKTKNVIFIQKNATEGVKEVAEKLNVFDAGK
ncbi:MAG: NAD-dependent deacylase [Chitinophagales bacterium]|nr:NAD-dependent deacylase [Chitinophagales bacterium]